MFPFRSFSEGGRSGGVSSGYPRCYNKLMPKFVENFLNRTTMYRLVLYFLTIYILIALVLSGFQLLPFSPQSLIYSTLVLIIVCFATNQLFAKLFKIPANVESAYITAFILACIIIPPNLAGYSLSAFLTPLPFLIAAGALAMASKYIVAIRDKHIFNPAALGAYAAVLILGQHEIGWWIGSIYMLPAVAIGGLLITHKIRRFDLVLSFFIFAAISLSLTALEPWTGLGLVNYLFSSLAVTFFATVMLTEPQTTPPTRPRRIVYGAITGALMSPGIGLYGIYSTPELALVVGNVFSWLMSPKSRYIMTLKSKEKIGRDLGEFIFTPNRPIKFKPGQYLEWTLPAEHPDTRGNRRFFTIASSPTERDVRIGIRFDSKNSSSFKKTLAEMEEGSKIQAGLLGGDFTLPRNKQTKICFMAGGIGITPFRSMIAYMMDKNEKRDATLIYSCKTSDELVYTDIFHRASLNIGLKTASTLTDTEHLPQNWEGYRGFVDVGIVIENVPDYLETVFYLSGPPAFVNACEKVLHGLEVPNRNIRKDYFPGYV